MMIALSRDFVCPVPDLRLAARPSPRCRPTMRLTEIETSDSLLGVVLAGPDVDSALDGIYRVVLEIRAKAGILQNACAGL
jgi:hypothetical protein